MSVETQSPENESQPLPATTPNSLAEIWLMEVAETAERLKRLRHRELTLRCDIESTEEQKIESE